MLSQIRPPSDQDLSHTSFFFEIPLNKAGSRSVELQTLRPCFGDTILIGVPGFLTEVDSTIKEHLNASVTINYGHILKEGEELKDVFGWQQWANDFASVLKDSLWNDSFLNAAKNICFVADSMGIAVALDAFHQVKENFPHLTAELIVKRVPIMGQDRTADRMTVYDKAIERLEAAIPSNWKETYPIINNSDRIVPLLQIAKNTNNELYPALMIRLDALVGQFEGRIRVIVPPFKGEIRGFDKLHPEDAQDNFIRRARNAEITVHETLKEALCAR